MKGNQCRLQWTASHYGPKHETIQIMFLRKIILAKYLSFPYPQNTLDFYLPQNKVYRGNKFDTTEEYLSNQFLHPKSSSITLLGITHCVLNILKVNFHNS